MKKNDFSFTDAVNYLKQSIITASQNKAPLDIETIHINCGLNRVLAEDIYSNISIPPYTNAAMDGYAFSGAILSKKNAHDTLNLKIIGRILAGEQSSINIKEGETVRIMTGASIPNGCDTVIPQEFVETTTDHYGNTFISFHSSTIYAGAHCRQKGEDINFGDIVLKKGQHLRAVEIGILASLGIETIPVFKRLKIAVISTGDELKNPGEYLNVGQLYDNNRYTLKALLNNLNIDVIDLGIVPDKPEALCEKLKSVIEAENIDAIISSGGVSVGDADYTRSVLNEIGTIEFWNVAMRPGRPFAFGFLNHGKTAFWGLPGNPVATLIAFYQLVQPMIKKMQGRNNVDTLYCSAVLTHSVRKKIGRAEYMRGLLKWEDGALTVQTVGTQGTAFLGSVNKANCFIYLDEATGCLNSGDMVKIIPFEGLMA
jgi:molybdopterin molybdotransferase